MKFVELTLMNKMIKFKELKILIFELNKFKKLNRLILYCQKNECCNNCVDYFLNEFRRIKKLQKLELDLSNLASIKMKLKIKEQYKCQIF